MKIFHKIEKVMKRNLGLMVSRKFFTLSIAIIISSVGMMSIKEAHTMNNATATNKLPAVTAMVLCSQPAVLTQQKLEAAARERKMQGFSVKTQEEQAGSFIIFLNGAPFVVMNIDQPVPPETFNNVLQFSFGLDNAKEIIEQQKAHIIISPLTEAQHMGRGIVNAIGVTQIAGLISSIVKPVGYYWMHSDVLSSPKQFDEGLVGLHKALHIQNSGQDSAGTYLPRLMWIGFRLMGSQERNKIGAHTIGLEAFTGFELEITPVALPAEVLGQRIYGTVEYMFNNGPILQDGQTLGVSANEHFRLKYVNRDGNTPPRFLLTLEKGN